MLQLRHFASRNARSWSSQTQMANDSRNLGLRASSVQGPSLLRHGLINLMDLTSDLVKFVLVSRRSDQNPICNIYFKSLFTQPVIPPNGKKSIVRRDLMFCQKIILELSYSIRSSSMRRIYSRSVKQNGTRAQRV